MVIFSPHEHLQFPHLLLQEFPLPDRFPADSLHNKPAVPGTLPPAVLPLPGKQLQKFPPESPPVSEKLSRKDFIEYNEILFSAHRAASSVSA